MVDLVAEIMKARLLEAKKQEDEAICFVSIIRRLTETAFPDLDITAACLHFLHIIIEETEIENSSILLWDEDLGKLCLIAAYGLDDQLQAVTTSHRQDLFFSPGENIAGQVFSSGLPVFIENSTEQPLPEVPGAVVNPVSLACIPILDLGVLNLSADHCQDFSQPLRRNWKTLGDIIGHLLRGQKVLIGARRQAPSEAGPSFATQGECVPDCLQNRISDLVLDCMPQGICILDTGGKIVRTNRSIAEIQGREPQDLTGRSPAVLFEDPASFEKLMEKASLSDSGRVAKTDVSLRNFDGQGFAADINLARLSDCGQWVGYLLVIEDVSKKKAFLDRILQSEKLAALGTMAGGVSHDFNNLLMSILGHIQLILPQIQDEEILRRLKSIEKAVHDGSNTVRRLQRFTDRQRDPNALTPVVDLDEAVKDVIELTRPRWKNVMERSGRRIEIRRDIIQDSLAAINASDLREVLTNLLLNAIDAMPQGGIISFRSYRQDEHLFLEVGDTGLGMRKEICERIFDPFFTTKGIGNSGLGLSVSWSLVGRYGGDIQVNSAPGDGTTFVIKLLRAESLKGPAVKKNNEPVNSYRLMLVEDDPEILTLLRDMLRLKGHRVVALSDGEKALEMIDSSNFDLVVTDLGMPLISGWEIARRAKAKNPLLPVVMITGWGGQYEETDLARRGVDLMLCKPLSWDKLLSSIEKLL
ncbi:MAG: ATP-binding protein [Syntrophobacteraceae bacterium]